MIRTVQALSLAFAGAVVAGCGGSDEEPPPQAARRVPVAVTIELRHPLATGRGPEECAGALDYDQIRTGAVTTFKDAEGRVIGTAKLSPQLSGESVVCAWSARTVLKSASAYFTAEVGSWESLPRRMRDGEVSFVLDTVKEDPEFGSSPGPDPGWTTSQ